MISASPDVLEERTELLHSRGVVPRLDVHVSGNEINLLEVGSGGLAGGMAASQELSQAAQSLNFEGSRARDIMTLLQNTKNQEDDRIEHMSVDAQVANRLWHEEPQKRYKEAKRLTTGVVLYQG